MSGLGKLPRGTTNPTQSTPIATSRWATAEEIARYAYHDGDIWLGVQPVPHADAGALIDDLTGIHRQIAALTTVEATWQASILAEIDRQLAALSATDELHIGSSDDRHLITAGGTRGGKGTSAIVPNLCLYPHSVICIDPKGENAKITASRRGMGSKHCDGLGQTVAVLDPYNTTKLPDAFKAAWNPFDTLDLDDPQMVDKATSLVEALIIRSNPEHTHFDDAARVLIKGIVLYVAVVYACRHDRNLLTVYDLLTRGAVEQLAIDVEAEAREAEAAGKESSVEPDPDPFAYLLFLMSRREEFGGIIAGAAQMVLQMGDRERGSVLSTARINLEFLERPAMRDVLSTSSFSLDDLKTNPAGMTLYLCLPPQRMIDCGRWLRLVINTCLNRMYEIDEPPATGGPVLFLLEEFASLKHLEIVEHAAGYAAGFGVKLWVIVQDLPQLKRHYKEGWETFVGNAGVLEGFANSDETTLGFWSKKLGETEVTQIVTNLTTNVTASTNDPSAQQRMQGLLSARSAAGFVAAPLGLLFDQQSTGQSASTSQSHNEQIQKTPLLLPDEIERLFRREAMTELVSIKGERPMALLRRNYFEEPLFAGKFDPIREPVLTKSEALTVAAEVRSARDRDRQRVIAEARQLAADLGGMLAKAKNKR